MIPIFLPSKYAPTFLLSEDPGTGPGPCPPHSVSLTKLPRNEFKRLNRDLHVQVLVPHFTRIRLRARALLPATPVGEAHVPTVPSTDDFAVLNDAFGQRKAQVRAEVLQGVEGLIPPEKCDVEAVDLDGMADPVLGDLVEGGDPNPFIHLVPRN